MIGVSGLNRTVAVTAFNESVVAKSNTVSGDTTGFTGTNPKLLSSISYVDKALDLCLSSNIHEKLGMSFKDLMLIDIWTFTKLKRAIDQHRPVEDEALNSIVKQYQKQG